MSEHPTPAAAASATRGTGASVMRTAPVAPLHDDGVRVFTIGTIVFVVAALVLWFGPASWQVPQWWLSVSVAGVVIGAIATGYCIWRRNKRARDAALGIAPPTA